MDKEGMSSKLFYSSIKTAVKLMPIVPAAAITIGTAATVYKIITAVTKK